MITTSSSYRPQLFGMLAGLFLAAGLVLAALVVARAWLHIAESQTITVTGSARKNVKSDLIVWRGTATAERETLAAAQKDLSSSVVKVEAFCRERGLTNYTVSAIAIQEFAARNNEAGMAGKTIGYKLSQSVEIASPEVERVERFSRASSELVAQGVVFLSGAPQYIYTKANETKVEMLAEATKDALARAEQIAQQGGRQIKGLRSAKMGVFQITPLYSSEVRWEGVSDTTALEKTITAVVTATFSMK